MNQTDFVVQQNRNANQAALGCGSIGTITQVHIDAANEWVKPLADRDGFGGARLYTSDIAVMLELGRVSSAQFSGNIQAAGSLRTLLLVDMASVVKVIRWGMAPQEDEPTAEIRFRLTARGRRLLQQCCKDLWDKMLYGKPE